MIEITDGMKAAFNAVEKLPNCSMALLARALKQRGLSTELSTDRKNNESSRMTFVTIAQFLDKAKSKKLSFQSKMRIIDQAIVLLEQFYAHLPFKRARYAIDPVRKLRLLEGQVIQMQMEEADQVDDLVFHRQMVDAFSELRDPHTFYSLPAPYAGAVAFLPIGLSCCFDKTDPSNIRKRFVVTWSLSGFHDEHLGHFAEITYWNGVPIEQAVKLVAEKISGGNESAKLFRGLTLLTARSLASTPPPDELFVYVRYRAYYTNFRDDKPRPQGSLNEEQERVIRLPWMVGTGLGIEMFHSQSASICQPLDDVATARDILFNGSHGGFRTFTVKAETLEEKLALPQFYSKWPDIFGFQYSTNTDAPNNIRSSTLRPFEHETNAQPDSFGYVQIKSFRASSSDQIDQFVLEFQRILELVNPYATQGLIVDIRNNPGGSIQFAERLLQMLTPGEITPARFHLPNTPAIQDILHQVHELGEAAGGLEFFTPWIEDDVGAAANGALLTSGKPLTSFEEANSIGQIYQGPVALLIDAGSYSATDIFAGGFKDHDIGLVVGVDSNTGGGGASRILHEELAERLKGTRNSLIQELPNGTKMGVALLRSARVGPNAGQSLEDIGVNCDEIYNLSLAEIANDSFGLLIHVCRVLQQKPAYKLEVTILKLTKNSVALKVLAENVDRVVCSIDGMPMVSVSSSGTNIVVPLEKPYGKFTVHGYTRQGATSKLVVSQTKHLKVK